MTIREAAFYAGIQVRTMREWIRRGKIKAVKQENNRYFISKDEVRKAMGAKLINDNSD